MRSCPICRREVGFYRRRRGAYNIDWVDLSASPEALPKGITLREALAVFHVQTWDGRVLRGAAAFAALWSELPAFRLLGIIGGLRPFNWLLAHLYDAFLRYRKLTPAQCGLTRPEADQLKP